ncbi:MAG: HNH endonuclease [Candidatus Thorarchaeota archaeon]|nr:MAG: HNH endonuclease [Candidatus Thorarchaeota archaeon]
MDDDDKAQCCVYLMFGFIIIYILYLFWQLIILSIVIVIIVYCIYRVVTTWNIEFSSPFGRDSNEDYTYTPPKQSYKIEDEKTPREVSKTYIDLNGYKRYSDSERLVHRHIAEIYVVRRKLRDDEVVHHINGKKLDNRAVNLRVMTWREHKDLHER